MVQLVPRLPQNPILEPFHAADNRGDAQLDGATSGLRCL